MKKLPLILSLLSFLIFSPGCKDDDLAFSDCFREPDETQLTLTVLDGPTVSTQSSKVSVFFRVTDAEGDPVGFLDEEDFFIYEQGLNDSCAREVREGASEGRRKISSKEQVFNHTTMLVLDLSGSVLDNSLSDLKTAAKSFINEIMPDTPDESTQMGIWWFDGADELHLLVDVTSDKTDLTAGVEGISSSISSDSSTDLFGAVLKATDEAESILAAFDGMDLTAAASVVFFTDGRDQASRYARDDAYAAVAAAPADISFFTLAIGTDFDQSDLLNIGKNGSASAANINQLTIIFGQIAQLVANEANSYYLFEYCSPKRSGTDNKLIIEASVLVGTNDYKVGFIETTFDATGFGPNCEF